MLDFDEDQSKAFNNKVMETASAAGLKLNHMDRYNENNADPTYLVFTL